MPDAIIWHVGKFGKIVAKLENFVSKTTKQVSTMRL
jgi:hypothetical protein